MDTLDCLHVCLPKDSDKQIVGIICAGIANINTSKPEHVDKSISKLLNSLKATGDIFSYSVINAGTFISVDVVVVAKSNPCQFQITVG